MSKELEALEVIKKASTKSSGWVDDSIEYAYSYEINILEKALKALEIIEVHKLLNYVLKNKKCASMYHLSDEEIESLKELIKK